MTMTAPPPTPGRYLTLVYSWFGTEAARPKTPEWQIAEWTGAKWINTVQSTLAMFYVDVGDLLFHWEIVKWQQLPTA